uniref:Uncharacterized protein n=1 Tax=Anguilla anguilla TaxID=7936 RepID=A0A0E9SRH0_ANGAN
MCCVLYFVCNAIANELAS